MDKTIRPRRTINFWKIEEEKEFPLFILTKKGPLGFNSTARFVWELLDGKHTLEEILNLLCREYPDIDKEIIKTDLEEILREFEQERLVILNYDPLQSNLGLK